MYNLKILQHFWFKNTNRNYLQLHQNKILFATMKYIENLIYKTYYPWN